MQDPDIAPPSLSTSGEDAITRTLDVEPDTLVVGSIDEAYDTEWTASVIQSHNYSRVSYLHCVLAQSLTTFLLSRSRSNFQMSFCMPPSQYFGLSKEDYPMTGNYTSSLIQPMGGTDFRYLPLF